MRSRYHSAFVVGLLAAGLGSAEAQDATKPNIVVIMGDDIGWSNIGVYNQGIMSGRTPHLDQLARRWHRFTDYSAMRCTAGLRTYRRRAPIRTGKTSGPGEFVVSSGDVVWWGNQGLTVADSPYWQRVNDTMLKLLPPPDPDMLAAGLEGRWFLGVGNHEVWGDPQIQGVLDAVPYLKKLGVTPENLIYQYDFKGARFIYLWSGKYDYRSPSLWDADRPKYAEQMAQLKQWLDDAKAKGIGKVFITFHYPVFARAGLGPIPEPDNPHKLIASYAKDMEITVFNGHVHTTEIYEVDGVKYLMLGGGGAEQDPILPGRTSIKVPAGYPQDLYWKGEPPKEDYNYVLVDVVPGQKTKFTLNRFRPWSAQPFATVPLFAG